VPFELTLSAATFVLGVLLVARMHWNDEMQMPWFRNHGDNLVRADVREYVLYLCFMVCAAVGAWVGIWVAQNQFF
jgi:hypothetical protein